MAAFVEEQSGFVISGKRERAVGGHQIAREQAWGGHSFQNRHIELAVTLKVTVPREDGEFKPGGCEDG